MKTLAVARKSLQELLREPLFLAMTILTPLAFVLVNYFGYQTPIEHTHKLLVLDDRAGGEAVLAYLREQQYRDGRAMFAIQPVSDRMEADAELRSRRAEALLILEPSGGGNLPFRSTIRGDAMSMDLLETSVLLDYGLNRYAARLLGITLPVDSQEIPLQGADTVPRTYFQLYAPGLMMFAILLLIPQTALLIGREIRTGTIRRLRLSGLRAVDYLSGITLAQLVLAVVQIGLLLAALAVFGFDMHSSFGVCLLVSFLVAFSAVGLGLLTGCFIHNDSQAVNLGSTVTMLLVFASGSFFPLPLPPLFLIAGHSIGLFDFLPPTHGMLALQQAMLYGADIRQIGFRLGAAAVLSVLFFLIGVRVFQRRVMRQW
jgi:ABC-2 type transport system permease protein